MKTLLTAAAIGAAWFAGHGVIGLIAVLAYCWLTGILSTANTAKARSTEARLNAVMPRIPNPQPSPGQAANNSYGPSNVSYTTSNSSYDLSSNTDNIGAADNNGVTSGQIGGAAAHYHAMAHGHVYGNLAGDFNALRDTVSSLIPAFNTHIGDHGNLVNTVSALRADHSNLLNAHNNLITVLGSASILM